MEMAIKTKRRSRDTLAFESAVKDCLSACESYKATSVEITQRLLALKERFNVPSYKWEWAWGYLACRKDEWWRRCVVHCHVWNGKVIDGKWTTLPEELKEHIRAGGATDTGFYWRNSDGTFTKPF
jgi:hypothetical protein